MLPPHPSGQYVITSQGSAQITAPLRILRPLSHLLGAYFEDAQQLVGTHRNPQSPVVLSLLAFPPTL